MHPIGNKESKHLTTGLLEESGSLNGRKRTRTLAGTVSRSAKSSPTRPTHILSRTLRLPIEQEGNRVTIISHKPHAPSPLPSPSKPRPSKRQKSSGGRVNHTSRGSPHSRLWTENITELDAIPSAPMLRWYKESEPRSRAPSALKLNTLTKHNTTSKGEKETREDAGADRVKKLFRCAECRKKYSHDDSLQRHRRDIHGESWRTPQGTKHLRMQTYEDDEIEMHKASPRSNRSEQRQGDELVEISRTCRSGSQPRRDTRPDWNASSPSRSIIKSKSSSTPLPLKKAESSATSKSFSGSQSRKRKREVPVFNKTGERRSSPTSMPLAYTPISHALILQSEPLAGPFGQRSSSVSSDKTIEDVSQSPSEDVSRQLWQMAQAGKSTRNCGSKSSPVEDPPERDASVVPSSIPFPSKPSQTAPTVSTSFSSLLRSSQPSKRIMSHGREIILGSDEDSDDSLPDVESLFKKKKPNPAPKVQAAEPEQKQKYAFSMAALLQEEKEANAARARIEAAKSKLQMYGNQRTQQAGQVVTSESAMACLVENIDQDEGHARRVKEALRRTEVLDYHDVWHFFDEEIPVCGKNAFPRFQTPNKALPSIFNDPARRHQAFTTGFLTRLAAHTTLPKEVMLWMIEEVCREPREILVQSYIDVLGASFAEHDRILDPHRIDSLFKQTGTTETALSPGSTATPSKEPVGIKKRPISSRLPILVNLLQRLAHLLSSESRRRALHLLVLASFDDSVVQDGHLGVRVEATIDALLKSIPYESFEQEILDVGEGLFMTVKSPILRHQLISALPSCSPQTHRFRRRLALAFILNSTKHLESSLENPKMISHILLSLQMSKHYQISKNTDYTVTEAYFSMLDVAFDCGFSDLNFAEVCPAACGTGLPEDRREGVTRHFFPSRVVRTTAPVNLKEKAFNEDVDKLTKEVRDIMSLIPDSGAGDMARTECKATAGRFVKRLENGVRTKTKPIKDYYDRNEQGQNMMDSFVTKEVKEEPVEMVMDDNQQAQPGESSTAAETRRPPNQPTANSTPDAQGALGESRQGLGGKDAQLEGMQQLTPPHTFKSALSDVQQRTPPRSGG